MKPECTSCLEPTERLTQVGNEALCRDCLRLMIDLYEAVTEEEVGEDMSGLALWITSDFDGLNSEV